jgi:hypothetical protein
MKRSVETVVGRQAGCLPWCSDDEHQAIDDRPSSSSLIAVGSVVNIPD